MAHDECNGTNVKLRKGVGLVLLDLGDRERCAVELEGRKGGRYIAKEDVGSGLQLYNGCTGFQGIVRDILRMVGTYVIAWRGAWATWMEICKYSLIPFSNLSANVETAFLSGRSGKVSNAASFGYEGRVLLYPLT